MMLWRVRWACALSACAALYACGSDEPKSVLIEVGDGSVPIVNTPVRDAGADAAAQRGPVVTVMSPLSSSDPIAGPVLTGNSVQVRCGASQRVGGAAVNAGAVKVNVYAGTNPVPVVKDVPAQLDGADVYSALVPLDTVPTGKVRFECGAADLTMTNPQRGSSSVETFYDAGPVITFLNLNDSSVVARGDDKATDVTIRFKVEPAKLAADDPQAELGEVKLSINDRDLPLAPATADGYAADLDLLDLFGEAPVASFTVAVTAHNKRKDAVVVRKQLIIRVDGEGPTIRVVSPGANTIVGGTVFVELEITDSLAGVAEGEDLLYALIVYDEGNQSKNLRRGVTKTGQASKYKFDFEASAFSTTRDIVAQISAFDKAGNKGEAHLPLRLDTVPPFVSLEMPAFVDVAGSPAQCSEPYAPLGASPRDGEVVERLTRFRALVWERAIRLGGATEIFFSGVRSGSVVFYAQDDPSVPLLIDTNNDKICDNVNNSSELRDKAPFELTLGAVQPMGPLPGLGTEVPGVCAAAPATSHQAVCTGSEMYYVTRHQSSSSSPIPVVYASAVESSGVGCTGVSFDMKGNSGWSCVVAAARDQTGGQGNLGISRPLRVCRKLNAGDCEGADPGSNLKDMIPSTLTCTDGCTLPEVWTTLDSRERR